VVALLAVGAVTSSCSPTAPTPTRIISLSGNTTGELAFGDVQVGTSATATLTISNSGNSTLTWSIPSPPPGVGIVNFSGSPTSGTVAAGGSTSVTITFTPTEVIGYSVTLEVTSDATTSLRGPAPASLPGNLIQLTGRGT